MLLIKPNYSIEFIKTEQEILKTLEVYGRVCYKSEDKITSESAVKFFKMLLSKKHLSVVEHEYMTVRFICDRGFTHELVRHRLASFSQESTRYCNYKKKNVTFIIPPWVNIIPGLYPNYLLLDGVVCNNDEALFYWFTLIKSAEDKYNRLIELGWSPQQARSVLPNSLKTEIVITANLREWKHIFDMRCAKSAHPQMRELMCPLKDQLSQSHPVIFGD